ncbi:hypothetical protein [Salinibaculum rarum]|uniref:hypothetical protein n=1 Tax=Salinibaculum rarum TaxID=3058903 RepID=UPI00265DB05E|nr:hypothetical protein [Salinibaculum sp. KK48]
MEHPHFTDNCTLDVTSGELSCDNLHRFRAPRLTDTNDQIEVTCQLQSHTVNISALPDNTLITQTRRLYERDHDRPELKTRLRTAFEQRDLEFPEDPENVTWFVIELTEVETRDLEPGEYPEAYQMSRSIESDENDDMNMRAMKISDWALRNIPDELANRAVPLENAAYDTSFFG